MVVVKLCYWNIRGYSEYVAHTLLMLGVPFERVEYVPTPKKDDPSKTDFSPWFDKKYTLGMDLPNLPYIEDGDFKLSQHIAIMKYLAHKYGAEMAGKTTVDQAKVDCVIESCRDMLLSLCTLCFNPEYHKVKEGWLKNDRCRLLKALSLYLGDKTYFLGEVATIGDVYFLVACDMIMAMSESSLDDFPNLKKLYQTLSSHPKLVEYRTSEQFKKRPFFMPNAYGPA